MVALLMAPSDARPYLRLGRRIAELRRARGLGQRAFARLVPISVGYLPKIEVGKSRPEPEVLRRIAAALGEPYENLAALAGYTDEPQGEIDMRVTEDEADLIRSLRGLMHVSVRRVRNTMLAMYHADEELFDDYSGVKDEDREAERRRIADRDREAYGER
jgi:transcriptional regulator with XRE-family HTH domain